MLKNVILPCLALSLVCEVPSIAVGKQITLYFDATVRSVDRLGQNLDLRLPSIGEVITISFSFDPLRPSSESGDNILSVQVEGLHLISEAVNVDIGDDRGELIPMAGRLADPSNTPIVDAGPGVRDDVSLSCASDPFDTSPTCGVFGDENVSWQFFALLATEDLGAILMPHSLENIEAWERFTFREASLILTKPDGSGVRVGATLGPATLIPEASSLSLVVAASLCGYLHKRRRLIAR